MIDVDKLPDIEYDMERAKRFTGCATCGEVHGCNHNLTEYQEGIKQDKIVKVAAETYKAEIYIAGDYAQAAEALREYCDTGFCVSLEKTSYIYKYGQEEGVKVVILNYPRFPKEPNEIENIAAEITLMLIEKLHQGSASLVLPDQTIWFTRRGENE